MLRIFVMAQLKGWYSKLQRDEVVAEWRKVQGKMTLHVHCHISGGNLMHNLIANLRFYIFRKELPVVSALHFGSIRTWHSPIVIIMLFPPASGMMCSSWRFDLVLIRQYYYFYRCWKLSGMVMKNFWTNIQVNPLDNFHDEDIVLLHGWRAYQGAGYLENTMSYVCWCTIADLDNSLVWVYFHSNVSDYNRLECWGPLVEAAKVLPPLFIRNCSP